MTAVAAIVALAACRENPDENTTATSPPPSPTAFPTPVALAFGVPAQGALTSPGKIDVYAFTLTSGAEVQLDVDADALGITSSFNGSIIDARLTLYAADGALLRIVDDGTTVAISGHPADPHRMKDPYLELFAPAGTYTVTIEDAAGNGGATGYDYRLTARLPVPVEVDPGSNPCSSAVALTSLDASFTGNLPKNDTNSSTNFTATEQISCVGTTVPGPDRNYKATLTSGQRIQIVRTGRRAGTGTIWDGAFYVFTGCTAGKPVACLIGGDGSDEADGVVFQPAVTGTYYLMIDTPIATPGTDMRFQLDLHPL